MDIYSLGAAHVHALHHRPVQMKARAEDRYYANHTVLPLLRPGLLGSTAMVACLILLLGASVI
jgi:hypothetical protein